ncbi:hypothetical protein HHL21_04485 [Massilia sp. RP-1-19]|uniref:Uncharacterized protein n=1 Tax=Massilia polaris TaxID=2728846 RepID=A0A848HEV2_9BURK|nr:hypothetical protein [Massilia polaris]NML60356.1 hypothetical protein [Massilia polaris]
MKTTSNSDKQADAGPAAAGGLPASGLARRRFARVGAGATGVLLTLSSPSGMAGAACVSGSDGTSHAVAYTHAPDTVATCGGVSPGYYKNNPEGWPADIPATTHLKFQDIYAINSSYAVLGGLTLMEVFEIGNGNGKDKKPGGGPVVTEDPDPENVGRHFLAAYLNLKSDRATVLDEPTLKRMWREYVDTGGGHIGYYQPSATVKWYGKDLVHYLTTVTFHN